MALLIEIANEMSGGGLSTVAANAAIDGVPPSGQPVEGERGDIQVAGYGQERDASPPSSNRGGGGQTGDVGTDLRMHASPVREPSASQRLAVRNLNKVVELSLLDTLKVRDGRAIGDVRFGEIETMRMANAMEASIFRQIQRKYAFAAHDTKLRELLSADELNQMKQRAAEVADAQ
ncbi:hypothetical protein OOZ54_12485 [Rhodopseudomonas palustris]|uniref:hypothetical protein n=1 Tax=Rhodopseudomonas palustris TaxID=1076 RepID=UPI0022F0786C|nr:hypothetical protein [Rhodopseudomonas palustris]WBU27511.1 hypothetical protein OOZ54_12485 [Rhodopseudomonas palustris]